MNKFQNTLTLLLGVFIFIFAWNLTLKTITQPIFTDIPHNHINAEALQYLKEKNIISGYENGNFYPEQNVNRAEFLKIVIEATESPNNITNCDKKIFTFNDTSTIEWYSKYICRALQRNIISGYANNTFRPNQDITFAEAAKIITNAYMFPVVENQIWHKPYIQTLAEKKAIPQNILSVNQNVSRGNMAEIMYRITSQNTKKPSNTYESLVRESETKIIEETFAAPE